MVLIKKTTRKFESSVTPFDLHFTQITRLPNYPVLRQGLGLSSQLAERLERREGNEERIKHEQRESKGIHLSAWMTMT